MVVVHLFIILYLTLYHDVKDRSELFACCNHSLTIPSFSSHVSEQSPSGHFAALSVFAACRKMIPAGFFFWGILLDNNAPLDILLLGTRFTQFTKCFTSKNFVVKSCPSSPKSLSSEPLLIPGIRITLTPHSSKATLSTSKCIRFFFVLYFSLYRSSALGISMATYRVAISLIFESHSAMRYWCV